MHSDRIIITRSWLFDISYVHYLLVVSLLARWLWQGIDGIYIILRFNN